MGTREEIIRRMCLEYRPDYDTVKLDTDPSWVQGLTAAERNALKRTMEALYDEHLAKLISKNQDKNPKA